MLVVIVVGAFYIKAANYSPFIPPAEPGGGAGEQSLFSLLTGAGGSNYGWYGLLAGASIVFFAFIGFDVVATTAEETKDPQRDVPRGIFGSLAIVTVLYVAVAVVLSGMVPLHRAREGRREREPRDGVQPQRRRLGREGDLHRRAGRADHRRHGADPRPDPGAVRDVPRRAAAAAAGQDRVSTARRCGSRSSSVSVVAVAAALFPIAKLEEMVNVGTLFAFVLVSAGVIILRRTRPDLHRALPGAVGAVAADRRDRGLPVADAEPDGADLDPLRDLDGHRHRRLPAVRPQPFGARPAGDREFGVICCGRAQLNHAESTAGGTVRGAASICH